MIDEKIDEARAFIDSFAAAIKSGRYSVERLMEMSRSAVRLLNGAIMGSNDDQQAEIWYQWARLSEIGKDIAPPGYDLLAQAKGFYERAIEQASRGSKKKLAFYRDEFAAFNKRSRQNEHSSGTEKDGFAPANHSLVDRHPSFNEGLSLQETLDKYLGASRSDIANLRLFNAAANPDELRKRRAEAATLLRQLVQQGPLVILPMLRAAPPKMRRAVALAASPIAASNPELYAQIAAGATEAIFKNAQDVIVAIGEPAVEQLLRALQERDPDVRVLAAAFLGSRALLSPRIMAPLQAVFFKDEDAVVQLAAAISLIDRGSADRKTVSAATQALEAFLCGILPGWTTRQETPIELCKSLLPHLIGGRD